MAGPVAGPIDPVIRARIDLALSNLEKQHGIEVLFAVESGSRAWDMGSPDSDYDVRGAFRLRDRNAAAAENTTRVFNGKDVLDNVSFFSDDKLIDVELWSVHKTLALIREGNTIAFEWMRSPIVYCARHGWPERPLRLFNSGHSQEVALARTTSHFYGLMASAVRQCNQDASFDKEQTKEMQKLTEEATRQVNKIKTACYGHSWDEMETARTTLELLTDEMVGLGRSLKRAKPVSIKKFCYSIRPALYLQYLSEHQTMPPLGLNSVLPALSCIPTEVKERIEALLERKRASKEKDMCSPDDAIVEEWMQTVREHTLRAVRALKSEKLSFDNALLGAIYAEALTYDGISAVSAF